jgi:NAD(P)-dependent dehydrogenase (short-subunit alcohol dehydrogenase family)
MARVPAVARQEAPLRQLAQEAAGVEVLSIDATEEGATSNVFGVLQPDILVGCAGAFPPAAPIHQQSWQEFAVNWETDGNIAFHFSKAALSRSLPAGASVILISSGAALAGSPNSRKMRRSQVYAAKSQTTVRRNRIGQRFAALAPRMMPDTELGKVCGRRTIPAIWVYPRRTSFSASAGRLRIRARTHSDNDTKVHSSVRASDLYPVSFTVTTNARFGRLAIRTLFKMRHRRAASFLLRSHTIGAGRRRARLPRRWRSRSM